MLTSLSLCLCLCPWAIGQGRPLAEETVDRKVEVETRIQLNGSICDESRQRVWQVVYAPWENKPKEGSELDRQIGELVAKSGYIGGVDDDTVRTGIKSAIDRPSIWVKAGDYLEVSYRTKIVRELDDKGFALHWIERPESITLASGTLRSDLVLKREPVYLTGSQETMESRPHVAFRIASGWSRLEVESVPQGASIQVNGERWGEAVVARFLHPGEVRIVASAKTQDGSLKEERTVEVKSGESLRVKMEPKISSK